MNVEKKRIESMTIVLYMSQTKFTSPIPKKEYLKHWMIELTGFNKIIVFKFPERESIG